MCERVKLTKEQQRALHSVYMRCPVFGDTNRNYGLDWQTWKMDIRGQPKTYLEFRRTAYPMQECLVVPWCGMWLGIEKDGYVHS